MVALKLYLVIKSGASISADLGSSSSYSNEIEFTLSHGIPRNWLFGKDSKALKVVAGKVSLCVAIRQGSVGPNGLGKP